MVKKTTSKKIEREINMAYNVVVNDEYLDNRETYPNMLVFNFFNIESAISFATKILMISDYSVEIIPLNEDSKNGEK